MLLSILKINKTLFSFIHGENEVNTIYFPENKIICKIKMQYYDKPCCQNCCFEFFKYKSKIKK